MNIEELGQIVEIHGKQILGFCYKLTGNKEEAEELYQEGFLKAVEIRDKITPEKNPKALIISIVLGLWRNKRRKFAWRQRLVPTVAMADPGLEASVYESTSSSPENEAINKELAHMIQQAVEKLDYKQKIPFYMYYTAHMSIEEIAIALKVPVGTVKSRLHRGKKNIKEILKERM